MCHLFIKKRPLQYKSIYKIICLLLISFFLSGCVTGQTDHALKGVTQTGMQPKLGKEYDSQRVVKSVDIQPVSNATEIIIRGNAKLAYTSVKQSFPLGIAVYLPETGIDTGCRIAKVPAKSNLSSLSALYADREKTSAKIEILLKENFDYEVTADNTDIRILIHDKPLNQIEKVIAASEENNQAQGQKIDMTVADASGYMIANEQKNTITPGPVEISDTPAMLTGINFTTKEDGRSEISIKTSHPVKYDLLRDKKRNRLTLNLGNTDIPEYRQRPLMTQYFKSAVNRILPVERTPGKKISHIVIELREVVPYRIVRNGSNILLSFEPSTIAPPEFTKAEKIVNNNVGQQPSIKHQKISQKQVNRHLAESNTSRALSQGKKRYTGEKIRLDFFETDIKNVFRILSGVSGKNFAVDKDVTGNVTLSLDKPVPWDQVLDLVLKMNRLGKTEENSIIRIATQQTLIQEQKNRQAKFVARKLAISQKKSLEPLVTEYIPINYANAATDIKSHLDKILTPKRGHLSVDARTNMIIMTDVQEKIDQAKDLIYKLDKVTPQIMIAARIVEVSKNFSRQLGIDWSLSHDINDTEQARSNNSTYGFDVAMNYPVASTSSIGYTFSRITGTPFALNATLSASETKGDVKIISSPKILTLDNKKAKIKQGLEFPYLERDDSGGSSVKFKDIDLLLEVTPHVTPDRRIAMSVHLTKDDVSTITNGVPSLSTNEAETELLVNDGNTIVIGGITKASINKDKTGFPGLSSIPVLGKLFSSETKNDNRNELLIFITPSIVQLEQIKN